MPALEDGLDPDAPVLDPVADLRPPPLEDGLLLADPNLDPLALLFPLFSAIMDF